MSIKKFKVIGSNILIKKINQQTFGSLLLPESTSDNFFKGIVCEIGNGKKDQKGEIIPFNVNIGDEVLFPKYKGHEIKNDDAIYIVIPEEEIIAIVVK